MSGPIEEFRKERETRVDSYPGSPLERTAREFMIASTLPKYSYNFEWLSRPIIQYPQDIVAMQEIVWRCKPDLIIETGIAHGGSLIMSASLLALLDYCDAVDRGQVLDPRATGRRVIGIDIDIRSHNRQAIETHPMAHRIDMIEGSSVSRDVIRRVHDMAGSYARVLVCLDSNHTQEHVLAELEAYAPLTTKGSYCCVFDTIIEDLPEGMYPDRPWNRRDNPKSAVREFLRRLDTEGRTAADNEPLIFEIDRSIDQKLLITVAPGGYLRRV
jgi:cephalosporin hydroxylase